MQSLWSKCMNQPFVSHPWGIWGAPGALIKGPMHMWPFCRGWDSNRQPTDHLHSLPFLRVNGWRQKSDKFVSWAAKLSLPLGCQKGALCNAVPLRDPDQVISPGCASGSRPCFLLLCSLSLPRLWSAARKTFPAASDRDVNFCLPDWASIICRADSRSNHRRPRRRISGRTDGRRRPARSETSTARHMVPHGRGGGLIIKKEGNF